MKSGTVYYRDIPAGTLTRDAQGYTFRYNPSYLANSSLPDISATLPKRERISKQGAVSFLLWSVG